MKVGNIKITLDQYFSVSIENKEWGLISKQSVDVVLLYLILKELKTRNMGGGSVAGGRATRVPKASGSNQPRPKKTKQIPGSVEGRL